MMKSTLMNLFGRSPIRPLQKHMAKAYACAKLLPEFFEASVREDWDKASALRDQIATLEREADDLKKDLRLNLPKGLFLPVPRGDLLQILVLQDRIANKAKDIAGLVLGREMSFPSPVVGEFQLFLNRCVDTVHQSNKAIHELDELLESGFRGHEAEIVEEMIVELDALEHQTDGMQIALRRQIFELEKTLSPIDAIFIYKIIEWCGELADRAQTVGGQLLLLLAN